MTVAHVWYDNKVTEVDTSEDQSGTISIDKTSAGFEVKASTSFWIFL